MGVDRGRLARLIWIGTGARGVHHLVRPWPEHRPPSDRWRRAGKMPAVHARAAGGAAGRSRAAWDRGRPARLVWFGGWGRERAVRVRVRVRERREGRAREWGPRTGCGRRRQLIARWVWTAGVPPASLRLQGVREGFTTSRDLGPNATRHRTAGAWQASGGSRRFREGQGVRAARKPTPMLGLFGGP